MPLSSASELKCVYNVPMASNMSSVTLGLDPEFALARNLQHLASFKHYSVGPMPVQQFMDTFLPDTSTDRTGYLHHGDAFTSVPAVAEWSANIYNPLVSLLLPSNIIPAIVIADRSLHSTRNQPESPAALGSSSKTLLPAVCTRVDWAT